MCRDSSFGSTGDIPQSSTLRLHAKLDPPPPQVQRSSQAGGSILRLSTRLEAGEARTAFNEDQVRTERTENVHSSLSLNGFCS